MTDETQHLPQAETPDIIHDHRSGVSRRGFLTGVTAAGALAAAGWAANPESASAEQGGVGKTVTITVMGSSDIHSNALNWDYYKDAQYSDKDGNAVGLAGLASVIKKVRADRGSDRTLLFDAGDTIQGTPLGSYYATVKPITETGETHPIARQMNAIGYDAVALGNHEFNYGLDFLGAWISQMDAPVLGANAVRAGTTVPAYTPYVIKTLNLKGSKPIRVGVLGLTNPGIVIWDKPYVEGRLEVLDIVQTAQRWVPIIRDQGVDVLIVSLHSGDSGKSTYGDDLPVENAAALLAEQVPGIDAILLGHAHKDIPQRFVTNAATGEQVVLSEPMCFGQRLSVFDIELQQVKGQWKVVSKKATTLLTGGVQQDPEVVAVVQAQHDTVVEYVNTTIATSTEELSTAESCWRDTAILDYIHKVQVETVTKALAGTADEGLPVLSIVAPFSRTASFPAGAVSVRDVAGLYTFDNTLLGSVLTGAQVKDYLEYSAKYFTQVAPDAPIAPDSWTRADGTADYYFDQLSGVTYDIDIAQPRGSRIVNLAWNGVPVTAEQKFVLAVNNYRQSGGGNFPHIATAPVIYNAQVAIREAIVATASAEGTIDPKNFHVENWRLTRAGTPVF
ncbi:bifunctional metallophosphatase/5'-nucleotidase [Microbacterium bovistercoris]|uniref:Bifunctional metallophosphatase/5'-nucleotidase n=1 Tax=Microbacterium bovistercoris TaxID=2293570 RepID=A0A371NRQ3_9MICO|nr:5'-nucleotidase C-terminal domain-containing protein [Microbacterium bovistercoris]REJ04831.1 bifunctional metallophosphatase/5'-nucleotidase [Microbacterium bovistercoris]